MGANKIFDLVDKFQFRWLENSVVKIGKSSSVDLKSKIFKIITYFVKGCNTSPVVLAIFVKIEISDNILAILTFHRCTFFVCESLI